MMKNKIENLLAKDYSSFDEEMQSHFFNYICVLESGYLEKEIQEVLSKYINSSHCNRHECRDKIKAMKNIQNAKWCSIRPMLTNIDESILQQLQQIQNFDQIISSIDNIVKTRHKIAHGENVTNLGATILRQDFENIKVFIEKLTEIFNNL